MWIWSALMPHPPVLINDIGRGRENEAAKTLDGIRQMTSSLKKPDLLLVLSPHQPYAYGAVFVNTASSFHGSFARFGAPNVRIDTVSSSADVKTLCGHLSKFNIEIYTESFEDLTKDQGSMVPLSFLKEAWRELPDVIIVSPIGLSQEKAFDMGKALAKFQSDKTFALLASGDLSHRLTPDAPAGYEPESSFLFEAAVEKALKENSPDSINELDEEIIVRAGECGLRSVMAMLGLISGYDIKVFSHEWPFGVGYCTALCEIMKQQPAPVKLARETVKRLLENHPLPEDGNEIVSSALWAERKACFVSIKTKDGNLRGCIGTLLPIQESLDKEIISNSVSASTHDPRFPPMTKSELNNAVFSVDVLSEPEKIESITQLNPQIYGVIVSKGYRHGVLLPDLEGVDTAEQQVQIAAMKAGLYDIDGIKLERFTVTRYKENESVLVD